MRLNINAAPDNPTFSNCALAGDETPDHLIVTQQKSLRNPAVSSAVALRQARPL